MRYLLVITCLFFVSCSSPRSETSKALDGTDSLVINFNQPGTDSIEHTVSTTESKAIEEITGLFSGQKKEATKCALDGDLQFFQKGTLIGNIVFSYSVDSCKQFFIVEKDGSFKALPMSNKARDLLGSLQQGKSWY
jgi:hypothetical protein